jgi:rubrerythrin
MKHVFAVLTVVAVAVGVSFADEAVPQAPAPAQIQAVAAPMTLENLVAAYSGELSAKEKYLAYAVKADQEGYKKVAQLFRGAAKSEEIHAGIYAKAITEQGSVPKADVKQPVVKNTKENLEDALNGEKYESETMYPKFLEQAKIDNIKLAMIGFGGAMKVESNHKALFESALKNLKSWKKASKTGFYVCKICGNLTPDLNFAACAICGAPKTDFLAVK